MEVSEKMEVSVKMSHIVSFARCPIPSFLRFDRWWTRVTFTPRASFAQQA